MSGGNKSPCRPDCPDRRPGCDCEKRQAWKEEREKKKAWLREQNAAESVLLPNRLRRFGQNKY